MIPLCDNKFKLVLISTIERYISAYSGFTILTRRQMDLEDEVRERNRGIALLQTKLQYTEQDNKRLNELCSRLKAAPRHSMDVLDSLVNHQVIMSMKCSWVHKLFSVCLGSRYFIIMYKIDMF